MLLFFARIFLLNWRNKMKKRIKKLVRKRKISPRGKRLARKVVKVLRR